MTLIIKPLSSRKNEKNTVRSNWGLGSCVPDVLTQDCKQESVEKMDRKNLGGSYMCVIDFHNGILCCGFYVPK